MSRVVLRKKRDVVGREVPLTKQSERHFSADKAEEGDWTLPRE